MKPKSKVGAGMRRGAPSLRVRHNKEGHRSHGGTPAPAGGHGAGLSLVLLGGGSWLHPSPADKEIIPRVRAPGVRRALDWAPFPLSARHHPAKIDPKNWWYCTKGTLTDSRSWVSVLLLLLFRRGTCTPSARDPLWGSPAQRRLGHILLSPAIGCSENTFAIFSLGFSVSRCRKLSL